MEKVKLARIAGLLYLLIIFFGLIAQVFVRDNLVDYGDAGVTSIDTAGGAYVPDSDVEDRETYEEYTGNRRRVITARYAVSRAARAASAARFSICTTPTTRRSSWRWRRPPTSSSNRSRRAKPPSSASTTPRCRS